MSGWYFGNLIFGGLIGMIAVDPATGAMFNIVPKNVEHKLPPTQTTAANETTSAATEN